MTAEETPALDEVVQADGAEGALIAVRAQPKSSRDGVEGVVRDADGRAYLRVRVTAPPADGAANAAIVKTMAKALGVARSSVRIASGAGARIKRLSVELSREETVAALSARIAP